jgi:hypothetical protein
LREARMVLQEEGQDWIWARYRGRDLILCEHLFQVGC